MNSYPKIKAWYDEPWWLEKRFVGRGGYTKERIDEIFSTLVEIFNAAWYREYFYNRNHPFINNIISKGTFVFDILTGFGDDLLVCKEHNQLNNAVKKLRVPDSYQSERDELFFCAAFLRRGIQATRESENPNNRKNYDIHVSHEGGELAIEIKSTRLSPHQKEVSKVGEYIFHKVKDKFQGKIRGLNVEYSEEFAAHSMTHEGIIFLRREKDHIADLIIKGIRDSIENKNWGTHDLNGLLTYTIHKPDGTTNYGGSYTGFEYNPVLEAYHIANIINDKPDQLPIGCPGIYIVKTDTVGHFNSSVEPIFQKKLWVKPDFKHVGGMLILDRSLYSPDRPFPTRFAYIPNPNCKIRTSQNKAFVFLTKELLKIEKDII